MYQFFERFALFWHFHKTYKLFVNAIFIMLISIHLVLFRHPINGVDSMFSRFKTLFIEPSHTLGEQIAS